MNTHLKNSNSDYRQKFYARYVSAFKGLGGRNSRLHDYTFSDSKLIPLIKPWLENLSRDSRCLDLGCGHGNILHALRTLGFQQLEGVDLSAEQVEIARREFPQVQVMGLMEKLQTAPPASYNLITLFDVIEHLTKNEILDLFELVVSRLALGGTFIVHCPNGDSPFVGTVRFGDFTHETILTPLSARNLCNLFGLEDFEAGEHLGASTSLSGGCQAFAWGCLRFVLKTCMAIETGSSGSGILTRNFAFKVSKKYRQL
jgi:SAM-dependent methyltransferase